MTTRSLRALVDDCLLLLEQGRVSQQATESALERLLDDLACARHDVVISFDDADHPDPPAPSHDEWRALACARFPNFGFHNHALPVTHAIGDGEVAIGDAIDDIAGALADVAWRFVNTSEADASWHFSRSYDRHWGRLLRDLQRYIQCLRDEQISAE